MFDCVPLHVGLAEQVLASDAASHDGDLTGVQQSLHLPDVETEELCGLRGPDDSFPVRRHTRTICRWDDTR